MGEKTTVAFRVDEGVKQEWEEAAEGPEYDSLSHLIRLAVQRELADEQTTHAGTQATSEADSELLQSLNRLEREVKEIQDEIGAVGRETAAEEFYDLEQVLLEVLPTVEAPSLSDWKEGPDKDVIDPEDGENPEYDPQGETPETIAARIGAEVQPVSDALNRLHENTSQVERREIAFDNAPRYVRIE